MKPQETSLDPAVFRAVMGLFAAGVTVLSYLRNGEPAGMTANACMSVSMEPPLVLASVRRQCQFALHVQAGDCYGVSFLSEQQQSLSAHFGGRRVPGVAEPFMAVDGIPVIDGAMAHTVAQVVDIHPAGDHLLYIAQIEQIGQLQVGPQAQRLVFFSGAYKQIQAQAPGVQWHNANGW